MPSWPVTIVMHDVSESLEQVPDMAARATHQFGNLVLRELVHVVVHGRARQIVGKRAQILRSRANSPLVLLVKAPSARGVFLSEKARA